MVAGSSGERKVKSATEGGVANRELESPSLEMLSWCLILLSSLPLNLCRYSKADRQSSLAWISSSSLDVGLGTQNEFLSDDAVGVCNGMQSRDDLCDRDRVSRVKRGASLEPRVLRAHAGAVGKLEFRVLLYSSISW